MHLLLIEDEVGASDLLADRLGASGFRATRVQSPAEALGNVNSRQVLAVLLDQTRANQPPALAVQQLRNGGLTQPLLVLSPRAEWREKVAALDAGTDDYATKPIRSEEVAARLRAVIRRSAGQSSDRIVMGGIDLDLRSACAWLDGRCLDLTRNEFRMLRTFMLAGRQPVSRYEIAAALSPGRAGLSDNAIEVQIGRLRRKVGQDTIRTIRGVGYQLSLDPPKTSDLVDRGACLKPADPPAASPPAEPGCSYCGCKG